MNHAKLLAYSKWLVLACLTLILGTALFSPAPSAQAAPKLKKQNCQTYVSGPWESKNYVEGTVLFDCDDKGTKYVEGWARMYQMNETKTRIGSSVVTSYSPKAVGAVAGPSPLLWTADFMTIRVKGLCSGTNKKGNWYAIKYEFKAKPKTGYAPLTARPDALDMAKINCTDKKFSRAPRAGDLPWV